MKRVTGAMIAVATLSVSGLSAERAAATVVTNDDFATVTTSNSSPIDRTGVLTDGVAGARWTRTHSGSKLQGIADATLDPSGTNNRTLQWHRDNADGNDRLLFAEWATAATLTNVGDKAILTFDFRVYETITRTFGTPASTQTDLIDPQYANGTTDGHFRIGLFGNGGTLNTNNANTTNNDDNGYIATFGLSQHATHKGVATDAAKLFKDYNAAAVNRPFQSTDVQQFGTLGQDTSYVGATSPGRISDMNNHSVELTIEKLSTGTLITFTLDGVTRSTGLDSSATQITSFNEFGLLSLGDWRSHIDNFSVEVIEGSMVPEPTSFALLGMAGVALLRRSRSTSGCR